MVCMNCKSVWVIHPVIRSVTELISISNHLFNRVVSRPHKDVLINTNPLQQPCPTIALPPDSLRQLLIRWHRLLRHISSPITSAPRQTDTSDSPMSEIEMDRRTPKRSSVQRNAGISVWGGGGIKKKRKKKKSKKSEQPEERWRGF